MALSEILPSLFLSGADGAQNAPLVSRTGITLIVNATLSHAPAPPPGVEVLRVPVSDLPCARIDRHFDRVAERIHGNRNGKTLVHCAAGMSRSPALVMAYLMRFRGASLRQAHALVRDRRPHIRLNRGFWEQLLTYELRLTGTNTVRLAEEREEGGAGSVPRPLTEGGAGPVQRRLIGPMTEQNPTLSRPFTGGWAVITPPTMTPPTPRLRRSEPADRKCLGEDRQFLSQVPKSPLLRRRAAAVHSGSTNRARLALTKK